MPMGPSVPTPTLNNDKRCWSFKIYSEIRQINGVKCLNVKVAQFCLTLCDPMDYTVLQARTLEWVAFPFSRGSSQPRDQTQVSSIAGGFFTS